MARKGTIRKNFVRARRPKPAGETKHVEKVHVKKGDTVVVLWGDEVGETGTVMRTLPAEQKVVVEGINKRWKHLRRSQDNPQGGRLEREQPIPACKVRKVEG